MTVREPFFDEIDGECVGLDEIYLKKRSEWSLGKIIRKINRIIALPCIIIRVWFAARPDSEYISLSSKNHNKQDVPTFLLLILPPYSVSLSLQAHNLLYTNKKTTPEGCRFRW